MTNDRIIYFTTRDELLRLHASCIVCFKAEGNYTQLILLNGSRYTVCLNLSAMEDALARQLGDDARRYARVGKSHIINLQYVQHLSVPRQRIILGDGTGQNFAVPVSRDAIKTLKSLFLASSKPSIAHQAPEATS